MRKHSTFAMTTIAAIATMVPVAMQARDRQANSSSRLLLEDIRDRASAARVEADYLKEMINSGRFSPLSHLARLDAVKADLNQIGKDLVKLEAERETLPDWEKQAFDRVLPLAQDAVTNANNAIDFYKNNTLHLWGAEDAGYASAIYTDSSRMASSLSQYLKHEHLQEKETSLGAKIAIESDR
jgi:hypothetical protein